jgi:chaperonin cofactor prefoldin
LDQIQTTAVQSQRALSVARQQTAAKERERRILQLTIDEIDQMEDDVNLYKGVGKMFVKSRWPSWLSTLTGNRFLMIPRTPMEQELKGQEKELTDDINNLNKKVCPAEISCRHCSFLMSCSQNTWKNSSTTRRVSSAI